MEMSVKLMKLKRATTLLSVASVVSMTAIGILPHSAEAAHAKHGHVRISHAKELLGGTYRRSVVRKTESADDVSEFVKAATLRFLPKHYKKSASKISATVMAEAERYGFDPIFLMAVIQNESSFNPRRKGHFGEIGLMQLKPSTAKWIAHTYKISYHGAKSLYNPETNIKIGAAYFHKLRDQFEAHSRLYLSAYNIGAKKVREMVSDKRIPKEYVIAVMKRYLAIYAAFGTDGTHREKGQMAWLKVSNLTPNRSPTQVATNP